MKLISTRQGHSATPLEAVLRGLAPDGGLYVPSHFPHFDEATIRDMATWSYADIAAKVVGAYFDEIPEQTMRSMCQTAYASFDCEAVVPLTSLDDETVAQELYHGPTLAFKDVALQLLPQLLAYGAQHTGLAQKVMILVATSGDTGKAALAGFADKKDTAICVFYPERGVSDAQKLQMQTQTGDNVSVFAVRGDFDDCQRGVKQLMGEETFVSALREKGYVLSSANSINFGRLVPQVAYYFAAYTALMRRGELSFGEPLNFAVPTGNFGNILAGWMAKRMGLPIGRLIGASNRNNVLDEFYHTGVYRAGLTLIPSSSPSMDILVSSNLERLLFELSGREGERITAWMEQQQSGESFTVDQRVSDGLRDEFLWGWASDEQAAAAIRRTFDQTGVLLDPHSAVGLQVIDEQRNSGKLNGKTVLLCTASPYKFAGDVCDALTGERGEAQADIERLSALTNTPVPDAITALFDAPIRHDETLTTAQMHAAVLARL